MQIGGGPMERQFVILMAGRVLRVNLQQWPRRLGSVRFSGALSCGLHGHNLQRLVHVLRLQALAGSTALFCGGAAALGGRPSRRTVTVPCCNGAMQPLLAVSLTSGDIMASQPAAFIIVCALCSCASGSGSPCVHASQLTSDAGGWLSQPSRHAQDGRLHLAFTLLQLSAESVQCCTECGGSRVCREGFTRLPMQVPAGARNTP